MKVILTDSVKGLGRTGEAVEVAAGYARNYLLPRGLAERATPSALKEWESRKGKLDKKIAEERAGAEELAAKLGARAVLISAKSGEEGKLFGSVTSKDIAEAVNVQLEIEIDRRKIDMPEAIKTIGEHIVEISLHPDVVGKIRVNVTSDAAAETAASAE